MNIFIYIFFKYFAEDISSVRGGMHFFPHYLGRKMLKYVPAGDHAFLINLSLLSFQFIIIIIIFKVYRGAHGTS